MDIVWYFLWFRGRVAARNGLALSSFWNSESFTEQSEPVWVLDLMSSPFSHTSHEASCRRHRCITRSTASLEVRILVRFLVTFWPLQWEKYKRPSSLSILECEKILYEKMVRAIVLYIVQNSGMFWNALFLYLLAAYVLSGFVIRIYIYMYIYIYIPLFWFYTSPFRGDPHDDPAILCIFLWCLMAGSRDNWPWHVVTQTLQNLERKKQINKKQLGPFRRFCLQQWGDLWMKIRSFFFGRISLYWRLEDVFFCVF